MMSVTNITIITFPCAVLFTYIGTCNINVLYDLLYMTRSIEMCIYQLVVGIYNLPLK